MREQAVLILILILAGVTGVVLFVLDYLRTGFRWRGVLLLVIALFLLSFFKPSSRDWISIWSALIVLTAIGGPVMVAYLLEDRRRRIRLETLAHELFSRAQYRLVPVVEVLGFTLGTYLEVQLERCTFRITDDEGNRRIPRRTNIFLPCQTDFDLFLYEECALAMLWKTYASEIQVGDAEFDQLFLYSNLP